MADQEGSSGNPTGMLGASVRRLRDRLASVRRFINRVTDVPAVAASLNQGRDELKEALRGLPDAVHVQPVSVADTGQEGIYGPAPQPAGVHGPEQKRGRRWPDSREPAPPQAAGELPIRHRSPGEIARDQRPYLPPKDQGKQHGHSHGL